jgi:hypothetical protein
MTCSYETDVLAWAQEQARMLRTGDFAGLDAEHLAEEIESMGSSQRRELRNRMAILLQHLLKWDFQPDHRNRSLEATLLEQRSAISDLIADSPSLQGLLEPSLQSAYPSAVRFAAKETGIDARLFPKQCPYALEFALADEWLPPDTH